MAGIELNFYLLGTAIVLFHIGMLGLILNRGNILKTIMSLEILLLSVNLSFITFSLYLDDLSRRRLWVQVPSFSILSF